jgi:hypothetical protein
VNCPGHSIPIHKTGYPALPSKDASGALCDVSGLSAPGEVLVSETVRSLARTSAAVRFEARGEQALKGVGEAVRVWAVTPHHQTGKPPNQGGK